MLAGACNLFPYLFPPQFGRIPMLRRDLTFGFSQKVLLSQDLDSSFILPLPDLTAFVRGREWQGALNSGYCSVKELSHFFLTAQQNISGREVF